MKTAASRDLYCYWDKLRGTRAAPERVEVDPAAIRSLLADTFILEVSGSLPYRIAGSRLCALFGHELRGLSFLEPFSFEGRDDLLRLIEASIEEAAAIVAGVELHANQGQKLDAELLILPLRHHGDREARLLGTIKPIETPYWIGVCPIERADLRSARILSQNGRQTLTPDIPALGIQKGRRVRHLTVVDGGLS